MKTFSFHVKKITACCLAIIALLLTSCMTPEAKVLNSLGEYDDYVIYSEGPFQDYTDYAKYHYTSVNMDENNYFTKLREADLIKINEHIDDFESWIETYKERDDSLEIVVNYDFNREIIDTEDYIYIDSETQTWEDGTTLLVNYDVYFFDRQTQVLYYFHNNL